MLSCWVRLGTVVDVRALPSLHVHVVDQDVKPAACQSEFPVFGDMVAYERCHGGESGRCEGWGWALKCVYIGGNNVQNWVLCPLSIVRRASVWGFLLILFSFHIRERERYIYIYI